MAFSISVFDAVGLAVEDGALDVVGSPALGRLVDNWKYPVDPG